MITAGTYQEQHFFNSARKLDFLESHLLDLSLQYKLIPQAWAVFSNHYHVVHVSIHDSSLIRAYVRHLHSLTAREVNKLDGTQERKVWHQYWDTVLPDQKSYYARINYVNQNPVIHRIVKHASHYPWCSATWLETRSTAAHVKTIKSFPLDKQAVLDDFKPLVIK